MGVEQATPGANPGRKQQQRSILTQQKLLDAAIQAFSENGFKGTSTRDIADRANVHHPLITYHFKNKGELWRAAANRIFREFNISLVKAMAEVPEMDPKARAEAFIRTYVKHSFGHPALHKIILQESSYPSDRLDWLVTQHLRPLYEMVAGQLVKLQQLGIAPPGNPALLYNMIRVSAGGLLALGLEIKGTSNINFNNEAERDALAEMIIRTFLPGNLPPQK
ncbi:MAG: TetR/AcrR family transcriptional regulator [Proteobacteria bacterium]|nr:TetR/AcrR family transcriptional regulator [Pseudomonadota bacterium]